LFIIIKKNHPKFELYLEDVLNCRKNIVEQVDGDQVNTMEENDDTNIIENDRIHRLIQNTLSSMDDNFNDVHDVPLIGKARKHLYQGSRKNSISFILLFVNLKVLNEFVKYLSHTNPMMCNIILHTRISFFSFFFKC
jgi:hypothetical protein